MIDASGRGSRLPDWLEARGLNAPEDSETCAILYYTRFYRLLDGCSEPSRGEDAANGDLGYLKFGVFPADAGTFSITLAVPEVEENLRTAVVRPDVFHGICSQLPGVARWIEPERAEAVSKVHAMGDLTSRWREMAPGGRAVVRNLFAVGDSVIRANPLFGRGCSFAAVEAHLLRDVLAEADEPDVRADLYSRRLRRELRPFFDEMRTRDREAASRAARIMSGDSGVRTLRRRLAKWLIEDGIAVAIRRDTNLCARPCAPSTCWSRRAPGSDVPATSPRSPQPWREAAGRTPPITRGRQARTVQRCSRGWAWCEPTRLEVGADAELVGLPVVFQLLHPTAVDAVVVASGVLSRFFTEK